MKKGLLFFGGFLTFLLIVNKRKAITQYVLTAQQEYYINQMHPDVQNRFRDLIHKIESLGWEVTINNTYRSWQEQAYLHNINSSNSVPGYSYHNYGMAVDLNASKNGNYLSKSTAKNQWVASGIPDLAIAKGFRWGGDFNGYYDPVHFDYPVMPTSKLHELAIAQFGTNPDNIYGNRLNLAA